MDVASVRFHPAHDYGRAALNAVGGPYLDEVVARSVPRLALGVYMPQIRMRRNRHELPPTPSYGIRLDQVLRRNVYSARSVRAFCGVPRSAQLVLLCFADDAVLERFWEDEQQVAAIARGDWDLITAPSFSLWFKRPRPMHFHAIKRSYDAFSALQLLGANAVPRAEFVDQADVEVQASWFDANPSVAMVSFDWMTCRQDRDWLEGVELLVDFDAATGKRLQYLINGTTVDTRISCLSRYLGEDRLTITEATCARPPRDETPRKAGDLASDLLPVPRHARRIRERDAEVRAAAVSGWSQGARSSDGGRKSNADGLAERLA